MIEFLIESFAILDGFKVNAMDPIDDLFTLLVLLALGHCRGAASCCAVKANLRSDETEAVLAAAAPETLFAAATALAVAAAAAAFSALVAPRFEAAVSVLAFLAMAVELDAASLSFFSLRLVLPDGLGDLRLVEAGEARCFA